VDVRELRMLKSKKLLLFIYLFYLILALTIQPGRLYTVDGIARYNLTKSIVDYHTITLDHFNGPGVFKNREGHLYTFYGFGQSVFLIPFYLTGKVASSALGILGISGERKKDIIEGAGSLLNAFTIPLICIFLSLLAWELGFNRKTAFILGTAYFLATPIIVHSRDSFDFIQASLLVVSSVYFLLRYRRSLNVIHLVASAFLLGFAFCTRYTTSLYLPGFLFLLWRLEKGKFLRKSLVWISTLIPWGVVLLLYNYIRTGSMFKTGYEFGLFKMGKYSTLEALAGLLFSPGSGLFVLAPFLILLVLVFKRFYTNRSKAILLFTLYIFMADVLFIAFFWNFTWMGGWSWGPRLILIPLPFLLLPLGEIIEDRGGGFAKKILVILLIVSFFIQIPAVFTNYGWSHMYAHINYSNKNTLYWSLTQSMPVIQWKGLAKSIVNMVTGKAWNMKPYQNPEWTAVEVFSKHRSLNVLDFWYVHLYYLKLLSKMTITVILFTMVSISLILLKKIRSILMSVECSHEQQS